MNQGSGQKVYADFPDWDADLIQEVLTAVLHQKPGQGYWHKISDRLNNVRQPHEIEKLWNELITKLEPPTFQFELDLIKRLLKRTVNVKNFPEVDGLPRTSDSAESHIQKEYFKQFPEKLPSNEPGQIRKLQLTPSEKAPYYVSWKAKRNEFDLLWFNYLKDNPEKFQEWSNVAVIEKWY